MRRRFLQATTAQQQSAGDVARWVLDANIVVKWALAEDFTTEANLFRADEHELVAPDVILWEAMNVLVGKAQQRMVPYEVVGGMLPTIYDRFDLYDSELLMDQALDVAFRSNMSLFDALYVLVAAIENCPLVTADNGLVNATRQRYGDLVVPLSSFRA